MIWKRRVVQALIQWLFIFPEYFFNFSQTCISHHSCEKFFVKITGRYICDLKNWICLVLLMSPSKALSQAEVNYPFYPKSISKTLFSSQKKEESIMELKLNLRVYWSQVLISSTIFANFTFLVSVCCAKT